MAASVNLDTYRRSAQTFLVALETEYYRHYAGLKETLEIEPLYLRHRELFERAAVESLRQLRDGAPPASERRRRLTMLLDFSVTGCLGQETKALEEELARREASLVIELAGRRVVVAGDLSCVRAIYRSPSARTSGSRAVARTQPPCAAPRG